MLQRPIVICPASAAAFWILEYSFATSAKDLSNIANDLVGAVCSFGVFDDGVIGDGDVAMIHSGCISHNSSRTNAAFADGTEMSLP